MSSKWPWRSWVALVAAYALAFQTLVVALSYGAQVAAATSDLHALCLPSGEVPAAPADPAHQPDCCVLGGHPFAKLLGAAPTQAPAVAPAPSAAPGAAAIDTLVLPRLHSPLTARGPPQLA